MVMDSGISADCLTAIVLNPLLNHLPTRAASATAGEDLPVSGGEPPVAAR